jgi:hypothetical protein
MNAAVVAFRVSDSEFLQDATAGAGERDFAPLTHTGTDGGP